MPASTKRVVKLVILVIVIAACAVFIIMHVKKANTPPVPTRSYYFDLKTGELFVDAAGKDVPFKRANGNDAVLAHIYSCGDCAKEAERFVGYYEALSQEAVANPAVRYTQAARIVSKDGKQWFSTTSQEGAQVTSVACPDGSTKNIKPCSP